MTSWAFLINDSRESGGAEGRSEDSTRRLRDSDPLLYPLLQVTSLSARTSRHVMLILSDALSL